MPILTANPMRCLEQEDFHTIDYRVMEVAFEMHNELGRHLEEKIYERELAYRLSAAGMKVQLQSPIVLRFNDYATTLFVDVVVDQSCVYELKAVSALAPAHRAQALTYVFLTGTRHGKLLNFGSHRVQHEFVSTSLSLEDRRSFAVDYGRWSKAEKAVRLKEFIIELVRDWGTFLGCSIYRNAVVHYLGGESQVHLPVNLYFKDRSLGCQEMDLLEPDALFGITAFKEGTNGIRAHLLRTLKLSRLQLFHWINLNKRRIEFETLTSD